MALGLRLDHVRPVRLLIAVGYSGVSKLTAPAIRLASQPVSGGSAAVFRVVFGLVGLVAVVRFFIHGWIADLYINPSYHFSYLGFGWVQPWPGWGMYAHFAALGLLSVCVVVGYRYRLSVILFTLGLAYVELIDKTTYLNHYYLMTLLGLLMVFLPLHHTASVDAWRNPTVRRAENPQWVLWILRLQLAIVYVFAGIAKLNPDWLLNAQPLRIWLYRHDDFTLIGPLLQEMWVASAMSWGTAFFDLTIAAWLLWHRSRPWAYVVLAGFHLMTWVLFPQLGIFPWLMMGSALIFFAPDWPQRLLAKVPGMARVVRSISYPAPGPGAAPMSYLTWKRLAVVAALMLFAFFQLAMPLRHFTYPGNVRWNEEGYRFAWRVMLSEKTGFVEYRVHDPDTGRTWLVAPDTYLTPLQTERAAIQPDMILQTAQLVAADFARHGHGDVVITADAFASWNGRANARLVDPNTDLARITPGLAPKRWVLPYEPN